MFLLCIDKHIASVMRGRAFRKRPIAAINEFWKYENINRLEGSSITWLRNGSNIKAETDLQ